MFKILVILLCYVTFKSGVWGQDRNNYCSISPSHTLCQYTVRNLLNFYPRTGRIRFSCIFEEFWRYFKLNKNHTTSVQLINQFLYCYYSCKYLDISKKTKKNRGSLTLGNSSILGRSILKILIYMWENWICITFV